MAVLGTDENQISPNKQPMKVASLAFAVGSRQENYAVLLVAACRAEERRGYP